MGWAKLTDKRALHPKLRKAGFAARGLDEAAICQVAADETDGFIATETVELLALAHHEKGWKKLAETLVFVGRWESVDGGWIVKGYLRHNPSAADMARQREAERNKKALQRQRGSNVSRRDDLNGRYMSPRDTPGDTPGESGRESPAIPSRPVPSPPPPTPSTPSTETDHTPDPEDEERTRIIHQLAATDLARRQARTDLPAIEDPHAWLAAAITTRTERHHNDTTPTHAATPTETPEETTARAQAAIRHRNQLPDCETCGNSGWKPTHNGALTQCLDCRRLITNDVPA